MHENETIKIINAALRVAFEPEIKRFADRLDAFDKWLYGLKDQGNNRDV